MNISDEMIRLLRRLGSSIEAVSNEANQEFVNYIEAPLRISIQQWADDNNVQFLHVFDLSRTTILEYAVQWKKKYSRDVRLDIIIASLQALEKDIITDLSERQPKTIYWSKSIIPYNSTQNNGVLVRFGI